MKGFNSGKTWRKSASQLAIGAALGLVLIASQPALAVETTAAIRGVVAGAAAGTKVTVVNAENGAKASATIRADGTYDLVGLRPGTYEVTIKGSDGKTLRETVILSVGETTTIESDMGKATEEVVVTGRRKEVKTSEVATSVSKSQMENLPQQGRNFLNFAALAPGVTVSVNPNNRTFQSGGVSANSVNVFIDGLSQKNQVLLGGVAGQDNSPGNPFPQDAIQEYKVSTQNFKAEYEQASAAIITAVTISGTNEFHGSIYGIYQSKDMIGQPYFQRNQAKPDYENKEFGLVASGPIIKDKLFWAATYEKKQIAKPTTPVIMPTAAQLSLNPSTPTASAVTLAAALAAKYNGVFASDFEQDTYWGKLTYIASENDSFEFSYKDRVEADLRGYGGTGAYERGHKQAVDQVEAALKWKHRGDNFLNEAAVDYQNTQWGHRPFTLAPSIVLLANPNRDWEWAASFGGLDYQQDKNQKNLTFKNDFTYTGFDFNGRHVIKAGFKYAKYTYEAVEGIPVTNPVFFFDANTFVLGSNTNVPIKARLAIDPANVGNDNNQIGLYVQDDWTYDKHWTFNIGLRWDYESNMMNDEFVTRADVAAALRAHVGFNKAFGSQNYISNGSNRESFKGAIQPRFGFSYDLEGDGQTVFFGGFGRYYDRNIFDWAQLEERRSLTPRGVTINFPNNVNIPWEAAWLTDPSGLITKARGLNPKDEVFVLKNDQAVPYSDQFNLGVRKKFGKIQTSATFAHTEHYNLFNWVLGNRPDSGVWGEFGDQYATQPWGDGLLLPDGNKYAILASTDDRRARSSSLYLTAEKPYTKNDGYGWTAKLDLNKAEMTGHNDAFIFDYANATAGGWHDAEGYDKWRFFGTAVWDIPWSMKLSGALTLASGTPFTQIVAHPRPGGGDYLEFKDGALYPNDKITYKQLDLKLSKEFALPNGQSLLVEGQVFNAFDWVNKVYSAWGGGFTPIGGQPSMNHDNNTQGPARSYQVGLKYKW